jgi:predicted membrane channel-forming protein YqfA (hemolysin III family)
MTALYERLYAEAFSQRTLIASCYLLAAYMFIQAVLDTMAGRLEWLRAGFFLRHGFAGLPFMAVLLARLCPIASSSVNKLFNCRARDK